MAQHQDKKSTFFGGAAILAVSSILVKVIGAIYKIPLGRVLPNSAFADFNNAYAIYTLFLTISTAGLPVALSKTISEANTLGRQNQMQKIFRVSLITFIALGTVSFLCLSVLSGQLATYVIHNPKAVYCVLALAPSALCVCIMAAFRGYFQGQLNMMPTGISQVIEALSKLLVGLPLAMIIMGMTVQIQPDDFRGQMAAVGAVIGVSAGSIIALIYILVLFFRHRPHQAKHATDTPDSAGRIFSTLMKLAIPITIGAAASAIVTLIDNSLVMSQLQSVFTTVKGMGADAALDAARDLNGIYGKSMSIYNLPFSMMVPLTACIIPAVSAALTRRDRAGAQRIGESALRIGLLLALPMGAGLVALGGPIMGLIFGNAVDVTVAGPLLSVLGIAAIFVSMQLLCNAILQANGMVNLPILAIVIGGIVKVIVNYVLVGNPDILINGAPVGTLCCFFIITVIEMFIIHRAIPQPPRFTKAIMKPFVASVLMGGAAWGTYGLLTNFLHMGNSLATVGAILVGVAVYLILVLALHILSKEDLELMPKGDKIAKILHIQ